MIDIRVLYFVEQSVMHAAERNVGHHYLVRGSPLSLIGIPIAITITMGVHRKKVVIQRLTCSSIGAKWHIAIIPIVNIIDSLSLMNIPIMMHLDRFGQLGPTDRRHCLLRLPEYVARDLAPSVEWSPSCDVMR